MVSNGQYAENWKKGLFLYINKKVFLVHINLKYCINLDVKKKFLFLGNGEPVFLWQLQSVTVIFHQFYYYQIFLKKKRYYL